MAHAADNGTLLRKENASMGTEGVSLPGALWILSRAEKQSAL